MKNMLSGIVLFLTMTGDLMAASSRLVKDETIALQKKLTHEFKLKNGLPVIYREIENSEIVQLDYVFHWGLKDQKPGEGATPGVLFDTMTTAAKGWPKDKVFRTTEKFGASIGCAAGVEMSSCDLATVNGHWDTILPMFAALTTSPVFAKDDVKVALDRRAAQVRSEMQRPDSFVNEVVNRVFYPKDHGYFLSAEQSLTQYKKLKPTDLANLHKRINHADLVQIIVVGSLPKDKIQKDLEKHFGSLKTQKDTRRNVTPPSFDRKTAYSFEHKAIPTAYISIKANAPGMTDADSVGADLMFKILSEELENEIRTKRSLSYAVHAYDIRYQIGIGVLGATTSKPKETLEAMDQVIRKLKTHKYSDEEIRRFKTIYATEYFLTLEEHASLAGAIAKSKVYYGTPNELYEMPNRLEKITSADIQRLANEYLANFRMGVIYDKAKFDESWANKFIDANLKKNAS